MGVCHTACTAGEPSKKAVGGEKAMIQECLLTITTEKKHLQAGTARNMHCPFDSPPHQEGWKQVPSQRRDAETRSNQKPGKGGQGQVASQQIVQTEGQIPTPGLHRASCTGTGILQA